MLALWFPFPFEGGLSADGLVEGRHRTEFNESSSRYLAANEDAAGFRSLLQGRRSVDDGALQLAYRLSAAHGHLSRADPAPNAKWHWQPIVLRVEASDLLLQLAHRPQSLRIRGEKAKRPSQAKWPCRLGSGPSRPRSDLISL